MAKTVSFHEADELVGLRDALPAYEEDEEVVVLESGTISADEIDLDESSYVVDGDLSVEGTIAASEEGGFLVVTGDLRVGNLLIGGPMVCVGGNLTADYAIATDYNHGYLRVLGDVRATIIAAEHHFQVDGKVECQTTIDFGGFQVADPGFAPTLSRQQAARESKDWFIDEVLNDMGYVNGPALSEVLGEGRDPLKNRP